MEWNRGDLETETDDQEEQRQQHRRLEPLVSFDCCADARADVVEAGRTRKTIRPGHAVEQDGAGEDAEQEVLQRAFDRLRIALGECR